MNDDIEKFNEQNRIIDQSISPGNQSQARDSSITSPDEDNRANMAEKIIGDLSNQRQDIDSIKEMIKLQLDETNGIKIAINQITAVLNGTVEPGKENQVKGLNMDSIAAIGELLEKGAAAYKSLRGNESTVDSFTQTIVDRSKQEAMQSLDIVSLINQKVKKTLVNDIAGDLAGHIIKDAPDTSHDPK